MTESPLISIITPLFNAENHIGKTISSVMKQTYKNWEMLIYDDCSSDGSLKIVSSFADNDNRIKILRASNNNGRPSIPRNRAVKEACGEYIAFLDADDLYLPEKLKKSLDFIKKSDSDIIYTDFYRMSTKKKKKAKKFSLITLTIGNYIGCLTIMGKAAVLKNNLFDEDPLLKAVEDYELMLRLGLKGYKIGYLNVPLSIYRDCNPDSISLPNSYKTISRTAYMFSKFSLMYDIDPRLQTFQQLSLLKSSFLYWFRKTF